MLVNNASAFVIGLGLSGEAERASGPYLAVNAALLYIPFHMHKLPRLQTTIKHTEKHPEGRAGAGRPPPPPLPNFASTKTCIGYYTRRIHHGSRKWDAIADCDTKCNAIQYYVKGCIKHVGQQGDLEKGMNVPMVVDVVRGEGCVD